MTPDDKVRRKAGRRPGRRAQEPVLAEQRERDLMARERRIRYRSAACEDEVTWRITCEQDDDAPAGYLNVVVTPIWGGEAYAEAAHGCSVHEDAPETADVLGLIEQASDKLSDILRWS